MCCMIFVLMEWKEIKSCVCFKYFEWLFLSLLFVYRNYKAFVLLNWFVYGAHIYLHQNYYGWVQGDKVFHCQHIQTSAASRVTTGHEWMSAVGTKVRIKTKCWCWFKPHSKTHLYLCISFWPIHRPNYWIIARLFTLTRFLWFDNLTHFHRNSYFCIKIYHEHSFIHFSQMDCKYFIFATQ